MTYCPKKLNKKVLRDIDLDLPEFGPARLSRADLVREVHALPYVPLRDAYDYAEMVADERGLSYA